MHEHSHVTILFFFFFHSTYWTDRSIVKNEIDFSLHFHATETNIMTNECACDNCLKRIRTIAAATAATTATTTATITKIQLKFYRYRIYVRKVQSKTEESDEKKKKYERKMRIKRETNVTHSWLYFSLFHKSVHSKMCDYD